MVAGQRWVVLDTETTGKASKGSDPSGEGHRVVEIGCVELVDRQPGRTFHAYCNPERPVDPGAFAVHGLTDAFLSEQPLYAEVHDALLAFVHGSTLLIHNAPFDVSFLNQEFRRLGLRETVADVASVIDTLVLARQKHPGQRNSLDALCKRYGVNASERQLHGALLDAQLLAEVYLGLTGGQHDMLVSDACEAAETKGDAHIQVVTFDVLPKDCADVAWASVVVSEQDATKHAEFLQWMAECHETPLWNEETLEA